jgi:hypothetical protein
MVNPSLALSAREVEDLVAQRAADLFGESSPVKEVHAEIDQTVYIARCHFDSRVLRCVVKKHAPPGGIRDPRQHWELHKAVRATNDYVRDRLVRFLGVDEDRELIFMEFVEGTTLEDLLKTPLRDPDVLAGALRQVASTLRYVHELEAKDLPVSTAHRRNDSYRQQLEDAIGRGSLGRRLGRRSHRLTLYLDRLPEEFWQRCDSGINLTDLQPKNVLVRPNGRICVVDLHYTVGNPAQSLAFFLLSLDLMAIRWPSRTALGRASEWKRKVLEEYRRSDPDAEKLIAVDLAFFYPWKVASMHRQHVRLHPWAGPYLSWFYGRLLGEVLANGPARFRC